jgi:hypothetical protein
MPPHSREPERQAPQCQGPAPSVRPGAGRVNGARCRWPSCEPRPNCTVECHRARTWWRPNLAVPELGGARTVLSSATAPELCPNLAVPERRGECRCPSCGPGQAYARCPVPVPVPVRATPCFLPAGPVSASRTRRRSAPRYEDLASGRDRATQAERMAWRATPSGGAGRSRSTGRAAPRRAAPAGPRRAGRAAGHRQGGGASAAGLPSTGVGSFRRSQPAVSPLCVDAVWTKMD